MCVSCDSLIDTSRLLMPSRVSIRWKSDPALFAAFFSTLPASRLSGNLHVNAHESRNPPQIIPRDDRASKLSIFLKSIPKEIVSSTSDSDENFVTLNLLPLLLLFLLLDLFLPQESRERELKKSQEMPGRSVRNAGDRQRQQRWRVRSPERIQQRRKNSKKKQLIRKR